MNKELALTADEMRELGYQVIDMIIDHFESLAEKPVLNFASPKELEAVLQNTLPEHPADADSVLRMVREHILGNISHGDHPRFFAFVPGPSNFVSAMADALVAGYNVCASNWLEASGPAEIERMTIRWLNDLCGFPAGAGGTFVSGGSMANLTAVAVARRARLGQPDARALVYYADQAHMSVLRGLRVLGFAEEQLRQVPTDGHFRMDTGALQKSISEDEKKNFLPFCIIANAGATNTGAVDPLRRLSGISRSRNMWLHVDGAYGAGSVISPLGRKQMDGIELADSITIDPHKWLFQPIESGCLLVRDNRWLRQTFDVSPEYLSDVDADEDEINYYQHGIQLTRQTRALKLWMSLKIFGAAAFRAAIEQGFENASYIEEKVAGMQDWQVMTPATLGIVTFRCCPEDMTAAKINELNQEIADRLALSRLAFIGTTVLKGLKALRMCPINPRTRHSDLDLTLMKLEELGRAIISDKAN